MKKIKELLCDDTEYAFLDESAKKRLKEIRMQMRQATLSAIGSVVPISDTLFAVFPFVGTRASMALVYALRQKGLDATLYASHYIPVCIEVRTDMGIAELCAALDLIKAEGADKYTFNIPENCEISGKYNEFIPRELLIKQYIEDYLDTEDMQKNME